MGTNMSEILTSIILCPHICIVYQFLLSWMPGSGSWDCRYEYRVRKHVRVTAFLALAERVLAQG